MSSITNYNLSYIKYAENLKTVCIEHNGKQIQYILNIQKNDDKFDKYKYTSNIGCLSIGQNLYHNMYLTSKMYYKSALYNRPETQRDNTTYDFANIFSHNIYQPLTSMAKIDNILFSYSDISPYGHINISVDSYSYISVDNGFDIYELPNNTISTCLYNRNIVKDLIDYYKNKSNNIPTESEISKYLFGIQYNMLIEIPGNIQNDYDSGNIAANSMVGKNHYNSLYTMEHDDSTLNLLNGREYVGIDSCNNQLFLKYYDNIDYNTYEYNDNLSVETHRTQKSKYDTTLQHIETISNINRFTSQNTRKSNLYSIKLELELFTDYFRSKINLNNDNELNLLKSNIKSNVRKIIETLTPAQTQLFDVYVS